LAADLLVVEDDPDLGDILGALLETQGHSVRVARNGEEGLRLVAARHPDLVLLDVEMPILTGPEMSYRMFLHDIGEDQIPVLLVSGVTNLARIADSIGTPYYLRKPYEVEALLRLIVKALSERCAPAPRAPAPEAP
jgi:DNA-binding response OmpR family regulator